MALVIRAELAKPGLQIVNEEVYNQLFTMHGTIMLLLFATPLFVGFANVIMPIQIGAPDVAFPRLNMFSYWLFLFGGLIAFSGFFTPGGAASFGWTGYAPLSNAVRSPGIGGDLWIMGLWMAGLGTILGAVNFITTIITMRAPGMTMFRMPIFTWNTFITSMMVLVAFPILAGALLMLEADRALGAHVFDAANGGPILWQHLFWFFGHPEVYIAILPGMGVASQLLSTFSRKPIFGYKAMVYAIMGIGFLGFMVWGHHMFMSGMSPYSAFAFSIMTMAIGVPSAIKTFNWLGTIRGGRVRFQTPMLYAIGFVSLFVSGGLSGPFLAQPVLDIPLHDTAFVVGHFHLIMGVAAIFGMFAGTYYWFPKMFGRMMNETWGRIHFFITLAGTYAIFMPMHYLGMAAQPRRYSQFTELAYLQHLIPLNKFITYAAILTISAQFIFVINLFWSMFKGPKANDNPWEATTLEWSTATPPPHDNFGGKTPVVYHGPYEYSVPGAPKDFTMQTDPATVTSH
jgi:cytochrome c oxidase subunit 1